MTNILGTNFSERLDGGNLADVIDGLFGNDTIFGWLGEEMETIRYMVEMIEIRTYALTKNVKYLYGFSGDQA